MSSTEPAGTPGTPVHLRDAVLSLPGYVPGARPGAGRTAKLSSNELPFPPQPAVLEAMVEAASGANRYPEMAADSLVATLARRHGVDAEQIVVGNGSVALIQHVLDAVCDEGDDVVVATKGGLVVDDLATKSIHRDGRPESLRRHVEGSLERLGVERIDLYYLHRVDPNVPLEESWGALAELVAEGKLARIGLSEVTVAQTAAAHAVHPVAAIQSELSVWTRDPLGGQTRTDAEENLLEWTLANGVAFVPFAPLGRGYLTGTLAPGTFESGDIRSVNPRFTAEAFERNRLIGEEIARIAEAHGATSAQVSLAWLLGLADNVIPIPGTRSGRHLAENLGAVGLRLSDAERERLDRLPQAYGSRY